jgi:RAD54-like protein 2
VPRLNLHLVESNCAIYFQATEILKGYEPGIISNSAKMEAFFCILEESLKIGDRILLFSQSLFTLNLIEDFLHQNVVPGSEVKWAKNLNYFREWPKSPIDYNVLINLPSVGLDGSTAAVEREKLINEFNANPKFHLFLVSTRAGSLGINLVGANRVIVFDASWNPCHDTQAVCRVYRYNSHCTQ